MADELPDEVLRFFEPRGDALLLSRVNLGVLASLIHVGEEHPRRFVQSWEVNRALKHTLYCALHAYPDAYPYCAFDDFEYGG